MRQKSNVGGVFTCSGRTSAPTKQRRKILRLTREKRIYHQYIIVRKGWRWDNRETQDFASLPADAIVIYSKGNDFISPDSDSRDAKSCVSQGRSAFIISILQCIKVGDGIIGRRKILRLYRRTPLLFIAREMISYRRTAIVETQNLASHKGEVHLSSAYYSA